MKSLFASLHFSFAVTLTLATTLVASISFAGGAGGGGGGAGGIMPNSSYAPSQSRVWSGRNTYSADFVRTLKITPDSAVTFQYLPARTRQIEMFQLSVDSIDPTYLKALNQSLESKTWVPVQVSE